MPKVRQHITFRDFERRNLRDIFSASDGGLFVPKKNKVIVEARNAKTGEIEETRESSNLIVYHGRSWLMQKAFGYALGVADYDGAYPWDATSWDLDERRYWPDMKLSWFALGNGGGQIADPLTPNPVESEHYRLRNDNPPATWSQVPIGYPEDRFNPSGELDLNMGYGPEEDFQHYHAIDLGFPRYLYDPSVAGPDGDGNDDGGEMINNWDLMEPIVYPADSETKVDSYLRALVRVTIQPEEYNGADYYGVEVEGESREYEDINQAGLFFSRSHIASDYSGAYIHATNPYDLQMFAAVNFSTIRKDETRQLVFSWYFYF